MSEPLATPGGEMPFRLLLDEAMRWTRRHFRTIYPAVAVPLALINLATLVVQATWRGFSAGDVMNQLNPLALWNSMAYLYLLLIPLILAGALAHSAMQAATVDAAGGRAVDMRRAWLFVVRPRVLATLLLQFLALMAAGLCCMLPLLYFYPLLSFTMAAMVEERIFLGAALSRSAELANYNPRRRLLSLPWVQILAVVLVGMLLNFLLGFLVMLPAMAGQTVSIFRRLAAGQSMVRDAAGNWLWPQLVAQLLGSLLASAVSLYVAFVISLLFFEVRRRREGADLRQAIEALSPQQDPYPPPPGEPYQPPQRSAEPGPSSPFFPPPGPPRS